ncbi:TPA: hypothetical protein ACGPHN_002966, partial [Escherichia coli]
NTDKIPLISKIFSFFFSAPHATNKHESIKRIMQGMEKYPKVWLYISICLLPLIKCHDKHYF